MLSAVRRTRCSWLLALVAAGSGCGGERTPEPLADEPATTATRTQALGVTHTVCASGCDFPSPAACAIGTGVSSGDTCLVKGGEYHETVQLATGKLFADLIFRCEEGSHCLIDGDGVRDFGFNGYDDWVIEGFEITGTRSAAITGYRRVAAVRNCYIHDVQGRAIEKLSGRTTPPLTAVAENNVIVNTWSHAVACVATPYGPIVIKNNLLVDAALAGGRGIECGTNSTILHNTVDVRNRTAPYSLPAAFGILGATVRYNVVAGGDTSIRANTARGGNLAWAWGTTSYSGAGAADGTDEVGNPLFFGPEDYHLQPGSPARDAAVGSAEVFDLGGISRTPPPDQGALEYAPGHVALAPAWPVRQVAANPSLAASPALALRPGQGGGPALAWLDRTENNLVYAVRLADGSWKQEVVASQLSFPSGSVDAFHIRVVALGIEPATGLPAIAYLKQNGAQREVRYARRTGDACGTGCASPHWSGCSDPPIKSVNSPNGISLRLAFHPLSGRPALAVWQSIGAECSTLNQGNRIWFEQREADNTWTETLVTSSAPACTGFIPPGIALSFSPDSGAAEIAFSRTLGSFDVINATSELVVASGGGGGFTSQVVPLGTGNVIGSGNYSHVAAAHLPSGDLGVAVQAVFGNTWGIGLTQRQAGTWTTPLEPVRLLGVRGVEGVDLAYDENARPAIAFAGDSLPWLARRLPSRWDVRVVDSQRECGMWPSLRLTPQGGVLLAQAQNAPDRRLKFQATEDPGGQPPLLQEPTVCDQCPQDPNKLVPGICGCGVADTDSDGDGTPDCNDPCPGDGAKLAPGLCGCGYLENPVLSLADASVQEGASGTTPMTFVVTTSHACGNPIAFEHATSDGTALAGFDYVASSGTRTIAAGATQGTFTIAVFGDTVYEADETFGVSISNPSIGTIGDGQAVGTIVNDDNGAPVAAPDSLSCDEDSAVTAALTANDVDPDGDPLVVTAVSQPAHGTAVLNPDGTVTYVPGKDYYGTDSFDYTVQDGKGGTATGSVTVTIHAVNDAPVALDDAAFVLQGASVDVAVGANDTDVDGDGLTVISITQPATGTASIVGNGVVRYTAPGGFSGSVTFTYTISDGKGGTAVGTVTVVVSAVADAGYGDAADDAAAADAHPEAEGEAGEEDGGDDSAAEDAEAGHDAPWEAGDAQQEADAGEPLDAAADALLDGAHEAADGADGAHDAKQDVILDANPEAAHDAKPQASDATPEAAFDAGGGAEGGSVAPEQERSGDEGGCACRASDARDSPLAAAWLALAGLLVARLRRKGRA